MGFENKNDRQLLSKIATNDQHGEDSPYFDGWKAYDKDPFHHFRNPRGIIQMGLAENQLCSDLMKDWIKENPHASICTAKGVSEFSNIAIFQDYHGLKEFRQAIAKFMGRVRGWRVTFDPDRIVMGGGATGANETVMFCLADPGDAFLLPSPYYPAFDRDLRWRTGVQILPVHCNSSNNFTITIEALESAYQRAQESNIKVKGLILTNPSNPLGTTLDRTTMESIVQFVNDKNIHLVCDEIYAATVFGSPRFVSVAEVIEEMGNDQINLDLIHIVYSLSKDMGLPGFRVGIIYSYNDTVVACARKMSSFGLVSSQTQFLLASMLSDEKFTENLLVEGSKRLAKRHHVFTLGLEKVGITCLRSNAGLFVWMDLRHLLRDETFESEMELWRLIVNKVTLNVSPGSSFHCQEPGWFRVCFANIDDETVQVALHRIQDFVSQDNNQKEAISDNKNNNDNNINTKKRSWKKNLRLSFSSRIYDDHVMSSPRIMSPQSPLLRART